MSADYYLCPRCGERAVEDLGDIYFCGNCLTEFCKDSMKPTIFRKVVR